jgi:hypothetical protein
MQILKKPPHLILLMPEIYYTKMANMAAYSEKKTWINMSDFPQISDWFYGKTKVNSTLCGHPYTLIDKQVGDQDRCEGLLHQFL